MRVRDPATDHSVNKTVYRGEVVAALEREPGFAARIMTDVSFQSADNLVDGLTREQEEHMDHIRCQVEENSQQRLNVAATLTRQVGATSVPLTSTTPAHSGLATPLESGRYHGSPKCTRMESMS